MCPGDDSASKNEYKGLFCGKGGRCVRLMTYHHLSAERQGNPGPQPTRNPLGHLGLLWETFTFLPVIATNEELSHTLTSYAV